jgi:dihydrodipicolinate synthase/N-acetylneuraminate lyase
MKANEFTGIILPLLSSFTKDGDIYEKGIRTLIEFSLPHVHGYFPVGTYGCGPLMSIDDRKRVLEIILDAVNGRIPVVAHVGHSGTQPTIELARHAKKAGAAGVGAIAPYYSPHIPDENLYQHFRSLIEAVNEEEFPVFLYNNPHYSQNAVSPKMLGRLAQYGLRGCKDSSFDIVNFFNYQAEVDQYADFNLIVGTEAFFVGAFDAGATGAICGLGNAFPELLRKLYNAYQSGDRIEAMQLQKLVLKARDITKSGPTVPILHEILRLRGVDAGAGRSPLIPIDAATSEKVKAGFTKLGLL